jgi:hypothetical protein
MKTSTTEQRSLREAVTLSKSYFDLQRLRDAVRRAEDDRTPSKATRHTGQQANDIDATEQDPLRSFAKATGAFPLKGSLGLEGFVNHFAVAVKRGTFGERT